MLQASFDAQLTQFGPLLFYVIAFVVMYVENGIMLGDRKSTRLNSSHT